MSDTPLSVPEPIAIPVSLITGFLGSGKTTLLSRLLKNPDMKDTAVVINEFGEVGLDHELVEAVEGETVVMDSGCLCCTVRGDLANALRTLYFRRARGEVPAFRRVVIETTGLADPAPVIQALMTFPVARKFRLAQVITTVDAVNGAATLDRHPEAVKQAAVADEIIITKMDVNPEAGDKLVSRLLALNPGARRHHSALDHLPTPSALATVDIYDPQTKSADVARWLNAEAHDNDNHAHGHHHHDVNRHNAEIGSFVLEFNEPLEWDHVAHWLDALVIGHGNDLLRVKGILDIAGRDRPIVVQAVQSLFHPPFDLPAWPEGVRKSRIVFITRNLPRAFVQEVLDTIRQRPLPRAGGAGR